MNFLKSNGKTIAVVFTTTLVALALHQTVIAPQLSKLTKKA